MDTTETLLTTKTALMVVASQGIPLERMVLETDGPYMAPTPYRGGTAHPGMVHKVAERIAEVKGVDLGLVLRTTRENTRRVYGVCVWSAFWDSVGGFLCCTSRKTNTNTASGK